YRDTIFDGAADPIVIYNNEENRWFMFYTNRRANVEGLKGVEWVHGTPIGIAESLDGGMTWTYRCDAHIGYGNEDYSFWAPDVIWDGKIYHMYLTVVPGIFADWQHPREIVHFTSNNLIDWNFESSLKLASDKVIDASVIKGEDGLWYMFYNNERTGKTVYYAVSKDLYKWEDKGLVVRQRGEGPKVFRWKDKYFMLVDTWKGQGIFYSDDLLNWTKQEELILDKPGKGKDDATSGLHADVVVNKDRAYIFYFTHPGRTEENTGVDNYKTRRSSVQVAELEYKDGKIICDRDKLVFIHLEN
ncbi:MAG: family 43 glycosylhydrolase, partial [Odoribacter sp.]|nr:family 43 glycosylhydrolase [Odoribacter sp.]